MLRATEPGYSPLLSKFMLGATALPMPFEPDLRTTLEAMLFVGGKPLTVKRLQEVFHGVEHEQIVQTMEELSAIYHRQRRPYEVRRAGAGWQLTLRPRFAGIVQRLEPQGRPVRLSQAAVELLALVAYKQPVTSIEIEAIRGADSAAILRQLRRRNLIQAVGRATSGSRAVQYGTTRRFLRLFGLPSLEDLPRVEELERGMSDVPMGGSSGAGREGE